MTILAIDIGLDMGWAVLDGPRRVASGTLYLSDKGRERHWGTRYIRLRKRLATLLTEHEPELVAYEQVRRHNGTQAAHAYGGLLAHIQQMSTQRGIPYLGVGVAHIKRAATGSGRAKKGSMLHNAQRRWGSVVKDHNEADALWCAVAAQSMLEEA